MEISYSGLKLPFKLDGTSVVTTTKILEDYLNYETEKANY